jgi:hypothetical protein
VYKAASACGKQTGADSVMVAGEVLLFSFFTVPGNCMKFSDLLFVQQGKLS